MSGTEDQSDVFRKRHISLYAINRKLTCDGSNWNVRGNDADSAIPHVYLGVDYVSCAGEKQGAFEIFFSM
jgi:hypothetical protein